MGVGSSSMKIARLVDEERSPCVFQCSNPYQVHNLARFFLEVPLSTNSHISVLYARSSYFLSTHHRMKLSYFSAQNWLLRYVLSPWKLIASLRSSILHISIAPIQAKSVPWHVSCLFYYSHFWQTLAYQYLILVVHIFVLFIIT